MSNAKKEDPVVYETNKIHENSTVEYSTSRNEEQVSVLPVNAISLPTPDILHFWAEQDLKKSGLTVDDLTAHGGRIVSETEIVELLGNMPDCYGEIVQGWALPFRDPETGEILKGKDGRDFWRVRLHYSAFIDGKPIKYLSPKDSGQHAFITPEVHNALQNTKIPLILTEGEKKAMCATKNGFPTIGLVGIWGWCQPGSEPKKLLPEIEVYVKEGRDIILVFDSDASDEKKKANFMASAKALAKALRDFECVLRLVILPPVSGLPKTGLDDFIFLQGAESFRTLLSKAEEIVPDGRSKSSAYNGVAGGRPLSNIKELADGFAVKFYDNDGRPLLARYRQDWYIYTGGIYTILPEEELRSKIMAFLRSKHSTHATKNMVDGILGHLASEDMFFLSSTRNQNPDIRKENKPPFNRETFEDMSGYICMQNGLLDWRRATELIDSGEDPMLAIVPHNPKIFATNQLPHRFDPGAKSPMFDMFLLSTFSDEDARTALTLLMGLLLVTDMSFNIFVILYGEAGTGKSQTLNILEALVGKENTCSVSPKSFSQRFATEPLTRNLLNAVGELSTDDGVHGLTAAEEALKRITSGDNIDAERKNRDPAMAPARAICVFGTNSLPTFSDKSNAVWDRMRIIYFFRVFRNTETQVKDISKTIIAEEMSGVFNIALKGRAMLNKMKRFPETDKGESIKKEHRESCDQEKAFLLNNVLPDPAGKISTQELYNRWLKYAGDQGIFGGGHPRFTKQVQRIFPGIKKIEQRENGGRIAYWYGVSFRTDTVSDGLT